MGSLLKSAKMKDLLAQIVALYEVTISCIVGTQRRINDGIKLVRVKFSTSEEITTGNLLSELNTNDSDSVNSSVSNDIQGLDYSCSCCLVEFFSPV